MVPERAELLGLALISACTVVPPPGSLRTNAQASHAEVEIDSRNGTLVVDVRDDGVGGADPERGANHRHLALYCVATY